MKRGQARELLMQLLFQMSFHEDFHISMKEKFLEEYELDTQEEYFSDALGVFMMHKDEIDRLISENLRKWKIERIPKVDLAILRVAIAEIRYMDNIPDSVSINEAVELAKKFGEEDSGKFINGILGKIVNDGNENP
ncbi:MAG: transcription antitermination factor NusB [Peptostreptococcales bacterium]